MKYFTISELCRSNVATSLNIGNEPNGYQKANMIKMVEKLLDPIRKAWGKPIYVNSGFRTAQLNEAIGGARNSQHMQGKAADITAGSPDENGKLFQLILFLFQEGDIDFDQLINEKPVNGNPSWIHISYNEDNNRAQILTLR